MIFMTALKQPHFSLVTWFYSPSAASRRPSKARVANPPPCTKSDCGRAVKGSAIHSGATRSSVYIEKPAKLDFNIQRSFPMLLHRNFKRMCD